MITETRLSKTEIHKKSVSEWCVGGDCGVEEWDVCFFVCAVILASVVSMSVSMEMA